MTDDSTAMRTGLGPGAYGILFKTPRGVTLSVGSLGERTYPAGWYVYVGSAMSGISRRLKHHLRAHERLHWHLDYLLPHGKVSAVVAVETGCRIECYLATALARRFRVIDRFGSSDCRCSGHLLQGLTRGAMIDAMSEAARAAGCSHSVTVLPLRGRPPA